ncbi:drug/metabolite transporter (DMT)-like permease [Clostridiales Family XIII bacterium PM5-7]
MEHHHKSFFARYVKVIVLFAVVAGASSGIFASLIEAPALVTGFWRLAIGVPFFGIPVLLKKRDTITSISKKDLFWTFMAGLFLFAHFISWFTCVKYTNIASASVLASLHPLVVLVVTVFVLKRKVPGRAILGIVAALLGGTMIVGFDYRELSMGNVKGDILAFFAAMFMGLYFAVGNEVRKNVAGPAYVFLCFLACWICFIVGIVATGTPVLGYSLSDYIYILALTLICQIGAHAIFNLSFGYVDSLYVSTLESGEAVAAIGLGVIFLGQIPSTTALLGSAVVVIGLLYYNYTTGLAERAAAGKEEENEL